jgi:hypothetical protein
MVSTPDRIGMQATSVQNHARRLTDFYKNIGQVPTPSTSTLLDACNSLESIGESAVVDRQGMIVRLGNNYVGRSLFNKSSHTVNANSIVATTAPLADTLGEQTKVKSTHNVAPEYLFGGSKPSNSKSGQAGHTIYDAAIT